MLEIKSQHLTWVGPYFTGGSEVEKNCVNLLFSLWNICKKILTKNPFLLWNIFDGKQLNGVIPKSLEFILSISHDFNEGELINVWFFRWYYFMVVGKF